MTSTVTVAIACYNHARFLGEAIESVLAQVRPAESVIVVDDGSSDDTRAVAARYPGIDYVYQDNAGLSAARNTALHRATTDRILFLDADDRLMPTALHDAMAALDAASTAAFAFGNYCHVDERGELLSEHTPSQEGPGGFLGLLRGNFIAMHGTVLYDREALLAAGGFDTALRSCEDYDVYLRLARHHPIASYGSCAAEYRRHDGTMTQNQVRMIQMVQIVLRRHREGLSPEQQAAWRHGFAAMTGYYADLLVLQVLDHLRAGRFRTASRLAMGGIGVDRKFAHRLGASGARRLWRSLRARRRRHGTATHAGETA